MWDDRELTNLHVPGGIVGLRAAPLSVGCPKKMEGFPR